MESEGSKTSKQPHFSAECDARNEDDILKALTAEKQCTETQLNTLILEFPEPELNENIVKGYSSEIKTVKFIKPSMPRYCLVTLEKTANIEDVCKEISRISFGNGKIIAEPKTQCNKDLEDIDPCTLLIKNLPAKNHAKMISSGLKNVLKVDEIKNSCDMIVHFRTVDDAIEAYQQVSNLSKDFEKLTVKFKRRKRTSSPRGLSSSNFEDKLPSHKNTNSTNQEDDSRDSDVLCIGEDSDVVCISDNSNGSNIEDCKDNVLKEAGILMESRKFTDLLNMKQESVGENRQEDNEWVDCPIKDEPFDSDYVMMRNEELYGNRDDNIENECEGVDNATSSNDWNKLIDHEEKPDVRTIPVSSEVPKPIILGQNYHTGLKRSSDFVSHSSNIFGRTSTSTEESKGKDQFSKKRTTYSDELDEIFAKLNSEEDDLSFLK